MIAIDMGCLRMQELEKGTLVSGLCVFCEDMLKAFEATGEADQFVLLVTTQQAPYIKKMFPAYRCIVVPVLNKPYWIVEKSVQLLTLFKRNGKKMRKKVQRWNAVFAKKLVCRLRKDIDLVWLPYASHLLYFDPGVPVIGTVHDLSFFQRYEREAKKADKIAKMFANLYIATISKHVETEVDEWLGKNRQDIRVIPNAVTIDVNQQEKVEGLKPGKFILDINGYAEHKNPITLLRAFEKIAEQTDMDLVFCGYKFGYYNEVAAEREKSPFKDQIHLLVDLPSAQRNWLLVNCAMLVTPSLYEGFGRTPIEAALCKRPVLSTKCTSLYGVTLGLVHYVEDPKNPDEFVQKMLEIIANPDSPEKLESISQRYREEYSHARCARDYMDYFRDVLKKKE